WREIDIELIHPRQLVKLSDRAGYVGANRIGQPSHRKALVSPEVIYQRAPSRDNVVRRPNGNCAIVEELAADSMPSKEPDGECHKKPRHWKERVSHEMAERQIIQRDGVLVNRLLDAR